MTIAARLLDAGKEYKTGESTIVALQPTTAEFRTGEITLLVGPSGSENHTPITSWLSDLSLFKEIWVGDTCGYKRSH